MHARNVVECLALCSRQSETSLFALTCGHGALELLVGLIIQLKFRCVYIRPSIEKRPLLRTINNAIDVQAIRFSDTS